MCRLYSFSATHSTRIDCELTEAQNSLLRQSREDERGLESPAGWGLGAVHDGDLEWEREVDPELLRDLLAEVIREVRDWVGDERPGASRDGGRPSSGEPTRLGLNLLWIVGDRLVGSRVGRSLWYVERDGAHDCPVCGNRHPEFEPERYRSVVVASERITDEDWRRAPERSVFWIDDEARLRSMHLQT